MHWDDEQLEVIRNPDIRVEDALTLKETDPEGRGGREPERSEVAEPEEEENTEPDDDKVDLEKRRSIDRPTEKPTETNERRDRSRHVPGGAWLAQVRSCLQLNFLPKWNRSGSERVHVILSSAEVLAGHKRVYASFAHDLRMKRYELQVGSALV
ncbi:hypothetical protein NDU88_005757 [Pleurodeles waltl]|uniref:Uncharacterized protein n=1 Tax=Pleurodeles waltl TaxID=8319 RepID=A0AAV7LNJ2_PLEWA|nr:hypothetical protein NDU88_005757 [Pleurodeles waltl]